MHTTIADLDGSTVTQYPYRTARLRGESVQRSDYTPHDDAAELEKALAEAAGASRDNHTVYVIKLSSGERRYIMFSDWKVGETNNPTAFVEGSW